MSKLPKAKEVKISGREKKILRKYTQKITAKAHYKKRSQIVLMAGRGMRNNQIGRKLKIVNTTVRKWRNRWALAENELRIFVQGVNGKQPMDKQVLDKCLEILSDAPRPGRPVIISEVKKKQITTMACEKPEKYDLPVTHWTHKLLAQTVIKEKILDQISSRYVGIILKKTNSVPIKASTGFILT